MLETRVCEVMKTFLGVILIFSFGIGCTIEARPKVTNEEMDQLWSALNTSDRQEFCSAYDEMGDPTFYKYLLQLGFLENDAYKIALTAQFRC